MRALKAALVERAEYGFVCVSVLYASMAMQAAAPKCMPQLVALTMEGI